MLCMLVMVQSKRSGGSRREQKALSVIWPVYKYEHSYLSIGTRISTNSGLAHWGLGSYGTRCDWQGLGSPGRAWFTKPDQDRIRMALSRLGSTAPFTPPAKLKEGLARTQASCSVFWPPAFSPSFLLPIPFYSPPSPLLGLTHTYTGVSYRIFHEVLTSSTFLLFLSSYFFCTPLFLRFLVSHLHTTSLVPPAPSIFLRFLIFLHANLSIDPPRHSSTLRLHLGHSFQFCAITGRLACGFRV